jgi:hypothetical protein
MAPEVLLEKRTQYEKKTNSKAAHETFAWGSDPCGQFLHEQQQRDGGNGRRSSCQWPGAGARQWAFPSRPCLLSEQPLGQSVNLRTFTAKSPRAVASAAAADFVFRNEDSCAEDSARYGARLRPLKRELAKTKTLFP